MCALSCPRSPRLPSSVGHLERREREMAIKRSDKMMLRLLAATALVVIAAGQDDCCSTDGDAADPCVPAFTRATPAPPTAFCQAQH